MKKERFFLTIGLVIILCSFVGCASTISTAVTRPAEINLSQIKNVAIGSFLDLTSYNHRYDSIVESRLTTKLIESGRFEKVVERQQLDLLQREMNLSLSGLSEKETALSMGKYSGAQAYIYGTIDNKYYERNLEDEYIKDSNGITRVKYTSDEIATYTITFKVIDVQSTEIIVMKTITQTVNETTSAMENVPAKKTDTMYDTAMQKCIDEFVRLITPQVVNVSVNLINDKNLPENKVINNLLRSGNSEEALRLLEDATNQTYDNNESLANAYNNYGLVYVILGEYDLGIENIKKAMAINPTSKKYNSSLDFAYTEKSYAQKYLEQMQ